MHPLEPKEICEIISVEDETAYRQFATSLSGGLALVAEHYGEVKQPLLKADAGDFAKWLRAQHPEISVSIPEGIPRLALRAGDFFLPLVFLASDIALPVYLHIVGSYIFEKMKGSLKGETARVRLSAVYQNQKSGVVKRFNFEGDIGTLEKVTKKLDLNQFLDE